MQPAAADRQGPAPFFARKLVRKRGRPNAGRRALAAPPGGELQELRGWGKRGASAARWEPGRGWPAEEAGLVGNATPLHENGHQRPLAPNAPKRRSVAEPQWDWLSPWRANPPEEPATSLDRARAVRARTPLRTATHLRGFKRCSSTLEAGVEVAPGREEAGRAA